MSDDSGSGLSRRQMIAAGTTGLIAATAVGTPEQIHLTWDGDPARTVVVSWASPGQADRPRVRIGQRVIPATERSSIDALSGTVTWTYHARVDGLRPGATYGYAVTADNDGNAADPFSATFTTAPEGRAAFRFTSFGDLATPNPTWAVETFQPLFHLLNGDLAEAGANPGAWGDFGNNVQVSAANRPWLPLEGRWYAFRVGTALFVCLSGGDDACSGGTQTRWLESTLVAARADATIDWIVIQLRQCAWSSAPGGNGSDLDARREWLPLFDAFEVDLVLSGDDHGYERSFPVRGYDGGAGAGAGVLAGARRPRPVTMVDSGVFDTSQGTVHLVLGSYARPAADAVAAATWCARRDSSAGYGIAVFDVDPGSEAGGQTSITVRYYHAAGIEPVSPAAGAPGAPGALADDYTLFETFTLVRPRSDGRRWHAKGT